MFESFTQIRDRRGRRLSKIVGASLAFHGVLLGVILFLDNLRVDPVSQPPVMVTFIDFAALPPPPPPPPPPKKKQQEVKKEVKIEDRVQPKVTEFMAPKNIPQEKAKEPEEPQAPIDDGVEGGVEGGVVGGVVGGVIGGAIEAPPPPPPPPPPAPPQFQDMQVIKKRRIGGTEPEYPKIARSAGLEAVVIVKMYITPEGEVGEVQFLKSDPHFEQAVRDAIRSWKFSPHTIGGKPVGTYTVYKFIFRLE